MKLDLALGFLHIEFQLLLIVVSLGLIGILLVCLDEILHELMVTFDSLCSLLLDQINLGISILLYLKFSNNLFRGLSDLCV